MGADWDYAQMAKTASQNGGPQAYLNSMKHGAKVDGRVQGLVAGAALVAAGLKGYDYVKKQRRLAAVAEQELLAGMKKATQAQAATTPPVDEPTSEAQGISENEATPEDPEVSGDEDGPDAAPQ